jgi:hypothetical protein
MYVYGYTSPCLVYCDCQSSQGWTEPQEVCTQHIEHSVRASGDNTSRIKYRAWMRLSSVVTDASSHKLASSSIPTTCRTSTTTPTKPSSTTTGMTTSGTTTLSCRSGTARNRFQPTSQHTSNFRYFGIEMLVGLVGHTFTIFTEAKQ